jgi:hypothetical protein
MVHSLFQLLFGATRERHPAVLHQPPQLLDAVKFRAVGWQKLERDALFLQQLECWLNRPRTVNRRVVARGDQGFGHCLGQLSHKAQKDL